MYSHIERLQRLISQIKAIHEYFWRTRIFAILCVYYMVILEIPLVAANSDRCRFHHNRSNNSYIFSAQYCRHTIVAVANDCIICFRVYWTYM